MATEEEEEEEEVKANKEGGQPLYPLCTRGRKASYWVSKGLASLPRILNLSSEGTYAAFR